ncbi:hypothetical protein [Nonomuraea typhae]|uniref:hypothetical protein n=1 Tax=Nonomuraea typhae TaxID=2603600 RepID=UPI0012F8CF03|nr:hypothetical protein [Nonomuraea typhae]
MKGCVVTVVGRLMTATLVVIGALALGGGTAGAQVRWGDVGGARDGQITSPSDGQVITGGSVSISARTRLAQLSMGLYVEGPSTPRQKVAGGGASQTLSGTFDAGDAPNGTFTVTLKGEITGTTYETRTFKLRRPAAPPSGVDANLQGAGKVVVTWSRGSEPDLQTYEVATTQSGTVGRMSVDEACGGGTCRATLSVPPKAAGQRVGFTVKAVRGDGDGGSLASRSSGPAYVNVPAPPAAKPTTKKAGAAPTAKPQTTKKGIDNLPTLPNDTSKKKTDPKVATPTRKVTTPKTDTKLPAMPETDKDGNLPVPTADDDSLTPSREESQTSAPADSQVQAQSSESPLGDVGQYGLYVAGGLVLLLLAAHFGAWARRRSLATATGPSRPSPGSPGPSGSVYRAAAHDAPQAGDSIPPTATAPRRPAVVLAVAKTRTRPDQSPQSMPSSHPHIHGQPRTGDRADGSGQRNDAGRRDGAGQLHGAGHLDGPGRLDGAGGQVHGSGGQVHDSSGHVQGSGRLGGSGQVRGPGQARRAGPSGGAGRRDGAGQVHGAGHLDGPGRLDGAGRLEGAGHPYASGRSRAQGQLPGSGRGQESDSGRGRVQGGSGSSGEVQGGSSRVPDQPDAAGPRVPAQVPAPAASSGPGDLSAPDASRASGDSSAPGVSRASGGSGQGAAGSEREHGPDRPSAVLPLYVSADDMRSAQNQADAARQEPLRIALPSSAVTEVAEPSRPAPAVRLEDRWDDYLPPTPRAMEDSGFWERPQPGDFWTPDERAES